MKKIGILTLVSSDNCGSLLQCYALQELLIERGIEVEVINFQPKVSREMYRIIPVWVFKYPLKLLRYLANIKKLFDQKNDYNNFRKKFLILSSTKYTNLDSLKGSNYSYYIVGSDQVWNFKMTDFDVSYLLTWVPPEKKLSFAASFGNLNLLDSPEKNNLVSYFSSFRTLSIREQENSILLSKLINKDTQYTLDPTLLINRNKWDSMCGNRIIKEKYIFYYSWSYSNKKLRSIVEQYSIQTGLKVFVINASKWVKNRIKNRNFILFKHSGPMAFLNLMKYAEIVFVESFHGIIFSNIFEKNFYYLEDNKDCLKMDKRIKNILKVTNTEERVIRTTKDLNNINNKDSVYVVENTKDYKDSINYLDVITKIIS